jgi:hypothetical protein
MLSTLDTVIAFAVIMTVLSLLITIIVQMVSAAFSLRGKNLANALALTFQTIDPNIGEHAHSLAAQILRDPILSDSIWRKKSRPDLNPKVQALIAAERKLKQAQREFAKNPGDAARGQAVTTAQGEVQTAKEAKDNLKVPVVKTGRTKPWHLWTWPLGRGTQLASAIRPGEVYRVLYELDDMSETEAAFRDIPPELVRKAAGLIAALQASDHTAIESRAKLQAISEVSQVFKSDAQQQAVVNSLANFGATVDRATTQAYDRFQRWFGSAQDRAEQWFQMHVRIVTIVFAILTAFLLQLDTGDIYRQLHDQPQLVEALVKSAPGFVEQGGKIIDPSDTSAYHAYLFWLEKHPSFELKPLPASATAKAYHDALEALLKEKSVKPDDAAAWLTEYDEVQTKSAQAFLQSRQKSLTTLKDDIKKTGFALVPTGFIARWDDPQRPSGFFSRLRQFWPHLFGILVTAGLLTLGAPFWFNLLKNLMSLRPAVANLIEKRPTSAPALPTTPATPPSSS